MSQDLSTEISPEIINSLILTGDMSKLTPAQQTQYYGSVCKSLNLNPLTQPFAIIVLQGKKTLYALKGCAQQLSNNNKISTEILSQKAEDGLYVVNSRAKMPDGRFTDEIGVVFIKGIQGADLANAMMKAVTKAKRRAVLALCGLGMPDESEVEDIKPESTVDTSKSKVDKIVNQVQEAEVVTNDVKSTDKVKGSNQKDKENNSTTEVKLGKTDVRVEGDRINNTGTVVREPEPLPEGHQVIQGTITTPPTYTEIGDEKKKKWIFKMGDLKLGTFDESVFLGITSIMDLQKDTPILLNIEYKERKSGDKTFRDIVKFSQATLDTVQVPI